MKYVYPAIFHPEEEGGYSVFFPDLPGCFTQGETMADAIDMAEDALSLMLWHMEKQKKSIPAAQDARGVKAEAGEYVTLVKADTTEYQKKHDNRAVKKTLSIPAWLNTMAVDRGVNFSNVLQQALMRTLDIKEKPSI